MTGKLQSAQAVVPLPARRRRDCGCGQFLSHGERQSAYLPFVYGGIDERRQPTCGLKHIQEVFQ